MEKSVKVREVCPKCNKLVNLTWSEAGRAVLFGYHSKDAEDKLEVGERCDGSFDRVPEPLESELRSLLRQQFISNF